MLFDKLLLVSILGISSHCCKQCVSGRGINRPQDLREKYKMETDGMYTEDGMEKLANCVHRVTNESLRKQVAIFWHPQFLHERIILDGYLKKTFNDVSLHEYSLSREQLFGHYRIVNFVLFIHDLRSLDEILPIFSHDNFDKKGKIVICLSVFSWTEDDLLLISKYLWQVGVANAILVVYASEERQNKAKIYGYWPLTEKECNPTTVAVLINDCNKDHFTVNNIFMRKMRNMHKCPIKASTISIGSAVGVYEEAGVRKVRGIEGALFNTLAESMNFTPVILRPPSTLWGEELPNGSWTGIHGAIKDGVADVGFCQLIPVVKRLRFEDLTVEFNTDSYDWIIREADPINWNKLILPFQWNVWLYICITVAAVLIFVILEGYYSKIKPRLLTLARIFFGQGLDVDYRNKAMKFFIVMWIIFSFIITNAYLGGLVSFLTSVVRPKNFETTRELLEYNIPFGGAKTLRNFYNNSEDPDDYEIFKRFQVIDMTEYITRFLLIVDAKILFASPNSRLITVPFLRGGRFHIMRARSFTYPVMFVMSRGSPYTLEFNIKMRRLTEAGFIGLWESRNVTFKITPSASPETALQLVHMMSIFLFWFIGLTVSGMVFAGELLSKWTTSRAIVGKRRRRRE